MWVNVLANFDLSSGSPVQSSHIFHSVLHTHALPTQSSDFSGLALRIRDISFTSTWPNHLAGALHNCHKPHTFVISAAATGTYQIRVYLFGLPAVLLLKLTPPAVANTAATATTRQSGGKRKRTLRNQLPTVFFLFFF